jgi:hypothetical protein
MNDLDTFSVSFITDGEDGISNADQKKQVRPNASAPVHPVLIPRNRLIPYCLPNPSCANDGFQFHMSKLDQHGNQAGRLSQPYNYNGDNHYALDGFGDLRPYRISILRRSSKTLDIKIYEKNGAELIEKKTKTDSPEYDKWLSVDDALPKQDLSVQTNGDPGSVLKFQISMRHGSTTQTEFPEGDFSFSSDGMGIVGAYCEVGGVNNVGNVEQQIDCDVPFWHNVSDKRVSHPKTH